MKFSLCMTIYAKFYTEICELINKFGQSFLFFPVVKLHHIGNKECEFPFIY